VFTRTFFPDLLRTTSCLAIPTPRHYVNTLLPYRPINTAAGDKDNGSTPQADPDADADAWPKILARLNAT